MGRNSTLPPNLFIRLFFGLCLIAHVVRPQNAEKSLTPCELETLIRDLFSPSEGYEMHAASLRTQLRNILDSYNENYQSLDENDVIEEDKRSISSLARDGYINGKRNIGALARGGFLRQTIPDDIKRSIATLAKNGQLPSREPDAEAVSSARWMDEKRNLGALARSGYLNGKRNIAALVRGGMLPTHPPKRSMSSLARSNSLPYIPYSSYKRNIGAIARDWALPTQHKLSDYQTEKDAEKRNIGSLKNSQSNSSNGRKKRDLSPYSDLEYGNSNSEIPEPVYQTSPIDYEELIDSFNDEYPINLHADEKRFLGSVARNGWYRYRPTMEKRHLGSLARSGLLNSDYTTYRQHRSYNDDSIDDDNDENDTIELMDKRHIGALARSGWLPSFRPVRGGRFSRSGRARSDSTTHKTVSFNPSSQAFVDDAIQHTPIQLAGVHQDYNHIGVHHPVLQHYTGEIFVDHLKEPQTTFNLFYKFLKEQQQQKNNNFINSLQQQNQQNECIKRLNEFIFNNDNIKNLINKINPNYNNINNINNINSLNDNVDDFYDENFELFPYK